MGGAFLSSKCSNEFVRSPAEADVVVSIDFGTTFSGCAYAKRSNPSQVYSLFLWPDSDGHYPKTKTELLYTRDDVGKQLVFKSWGASALVDFSQLEASKASSSKLIREFKLHLAPGSEYGPEPPLPLPSNLTIDVAISDFLREISKFCIDQLRETFGSKFSMRDVQWCLTVPAIWDDRAKQLMKQYAESAGLVAPMPSSSSACGDESQLQGSPYPLIIVLEPEAAAVRCLTHFNQLKFDKGDKFMTADLGGGTVDLVIHEKLWKSSNDEMNLEMREVAKSSGGLCGATYVDKQFLQHLQDQMPCFRSFVEEHPKELIQILKCWEDIKIHFNGTLSQHFCVPAKLADAWRLHNERRGCAAPPHGYGAMLFTKEDLINMFEPVVKDVIRLIEEALRPFSPPITAVREVKTIMAVGGFSGNPYLKKRLRETFIPRYVNEIVMPPNPGAAISEGAAMLGIAHKELITSRVSRKTYGRSMAPEWKHDDPEEFQFKDDDNILRCNNVFQTFVRNGEEVPSGDSVTKMTMPLYHNDKTMTVSIYSSGETTQPKYITDPGVKLECQFELDISSGLHLDKERRVAVTMYFGRSSVEVTAKGVNFDASGAAAKPIPVVVKALPHSPMTACNVVGPPKSVAGTLESALTRMRSLSLRLTSAKKFD